VRRDGVVIEVPAEQVRVGDALRLEEGDRIAADASLSEAVGLWLDESLLTGESLPVARQQPGERILAGSLVASGRGWAEVTGVVQFSMSVDRGYRIGAAGQQPGQR
jgi:Ca2+-transporting ATPase